MVLELHIFGPAFDLPSIDPESLAAVIYARACLPESSWKLVPSRPNQNPFQQLPALNDGTTWIVGFDSITQYLRDKSNGDWDLDKDLDDAQRADNDALHAFLQSRGLPLLDLTLYVSSDNYTACTRTAWSDLLSWPTSWTYPHQLRDRAKKRSEHLGLSALDVDSAQEKATDNDGFAAHIPKSLRKPKQPVSSLLGRTVQNTKFRLDAVTADFMEPLQDQLSAKKWLVGETISSADCTAIAYMALMQASGLPQAWLAEALTLKYASLGMWAKRNSLQLLGRPITIDGVMKQESSGSMLPWKYCAPPTWTETGSAILESIASSVPVLNAGYARAEISTTKSGKHDHYRQKQIAYTRMRNQQVMYSQILTGCMGAVSLCAWLFHLGILAVPKRTAQPTRKNFGEAGRLLGLG